MHWAYALLHGVSIWPQGPIARNDTQRKTVNLWQTYDRFGYRQAQFIRYFAAEERGIARTDNAQIKCSLYLRRGERALLVISNLSHEVAHATVTVDLQALGLPDISAHNALTDRPLEVAGNQIRVRIRPTSFVLAWVERAQE